MPPAPQRERRIGGWLATAAAAWALFGGLVLGGMATVTVVSVLGRALGGFGLRPITGDFELVEMGCAVAVFAFLPWYQLRRGHVTVDILVDRMPARPRRVVTAAGDALMALVAVVVLWRLWLGFAEKFPHGGPVLRDLLGLGPASFFTETTYELQVPVWIPYGLCLVGAALFALCCLHGLWAQISGSDAARDTARPAA